MESGSSRIGGGQKASLLITVLFVMLLTASCESPSKGTVTAGANRYRIGYMVCNSEQETLHRFRPLTAFLSKKMGVEFEAVAIDTTGFTRELDTIHFTHTNSLLYIIMNRNHGVDVLAAEKAGSLGARSRGAIVALKTRGLRTLKDLKGKSMLFGPMLAPTGYLSQIDALIKNGIDPEQDLSFYTIPQGAFKHEKVIYGVLFGKYDAGAFPMLDFERMVKDGRINPDDFTVIAETEPIPYCNFGVTQRVDEAFSRKFKAALLAITADDTVEIDGEVVKVLARAEIDGYESMRDRDFDGVREMAKRTNMPPYQKY